MRSCLVWSIVFFVSIAAERAAAAETQIPSMLECSALSKNPEKFKRFTQVVNFTFADNGLKGAREPGKRPGKEVYVGSLGPNKSIRITGQGAFADGNRASWRSAFSGSIQEGTLTEIKGTLDSELGGHRNCKITFLLAPERLTALLFPSASGVSAGLNGEKGRSASGETNAAASQSVETSQAAKTVIQQPVQSFGRRVALVVGNSGYQNAPALENPERDATSVAKALQDVGFQSVLLRFDLGRDQFVEALRAFAKEAENADWAVIYYAGHGIEAAGINYLVPIDAKIRSDRDVALEAVSIDQVLSAAEHARALRLVILDACRDNPFADQMKRTQAIASRSVSRGLAKMEPDPGTLVVFAAKHGETALDGDGRNSPFVSAFVKDIKVPGVEVRRLFDNVRDDVMDVTGRKQQPYSYGSVPGRQDFYFVSK